LPDVEMEKASDLAEGVHLGRLLLEAANQRHLREQPPRQLGIEPGRRRRGLRLSHAVPPPLLPWTTSAARSFHARLAFGCGSHFLRTISRSPRLRLRLALPPNHFTLASPPAAARTSSEPFHARLASGCGSHAVRTISRSPRLRLRLARCPNHFTLASPSAAA